MAETKTNSSASFYTDAVVGALGILKPNKTIYVQGRNPKIDKWYSLWKGNPSWRKYTITYTDGSTADATYLSVNLPKKIAETWANNYANENTVITIPSKQDKKNKKTGTANKRKSNPSNERLQDILQSNAFFSKFNNFVESFMAVGIGATVVLPHFADVVDKNGTLTGEMVVDPEEDLKISLIGGRRVIPITIDDNQVTECAFATFLTGGIRLQIHYLDDDKKYIIAEITGTGNNGAYDFDEKTLKKYKTNSTVPLFQIWQPNVAGDDDINYSFGTSIFEPAMDAFRQCDLAYTSYWKELKLGQKVKFISSDIDIIDENGNAKHPFDTQDESVMSVPAGADGKAMIQEVNGELRIPAIEQAMIFHMNVAASNCGLGTSYFEFSGGSRPLTTATAIIAKNVELYRNVIKQENYATDTLKKMVLAIQVVNNEMLSGKPSITFDSITDVQVTFDDNIMEDTQSKKQQDMTEVQNGVMSLAEFRAEWYDEDLASATEFLQNNAMLATKYLTVLQAGAMTPEMFVNIVYGENVPNKQELIDYITTYIQPASDELDYTTETGNKTVITPTTPKEETEENETEEE